MRDHYKAGKMCSWKQGPCMVPGMERMGPSIDHIGGAGMEPMDTGLG